MDEKADFSIGFGKTARTIVYQDCEGVLVFTFEASPVVNPHDRNWTLHLDRRPATADYKVLLVTTAAEHKRIDAAVLRVTAFAEVRGYVVEVT
jgi:hypothetical protein